MDLSFPQCVLLLLLLGYCYAQEIIIKPEETLVKKKINEGGFTLICSATGLADGEDAGLQWLDPANNVIGGYSTEGKQNRVYVMDLGAKKRLQFENVAKGDEGTYTCQGSNANLTPKDVRLELSEGITVSSPKEQSPKIFTDALIECDAKPSPEVAWLFGNRSAVTGPRYRQVKAGLIIKNITKEDNGNYVCMITSEDATDSLSFEITVTVTVPPRMKNPPVTTDAIVGQKFEMTCEADGTPRPKFKFLKGGVVLSGERYKISVNDEQFTTRGSLVIEALEDNDEGEYTCEASNGGGSAEEKVFVDTIVPPTISDITNKTAAEGSSVELECVARSDPEADVQWQILGSDVTITDDPDKGITVETEQREETLIHVVTKKLKFSNLKPQDTNNYTCTASNTAGSDKKDGKVIVEFKPNFDNTPYSQTYGWLLHNTEIKCVVDAVPYPSITWNHNGEEITSGGDFTITQEKGVRQLTSILTVNVNIPNEETVFGVYNCVARNMHGEAIKDITLLKADKPSAPTVAIEEVTPTTIDIMIIPPTKDGGQPILDYKIVYHVESQPDDTETRKADVSLDPEEPRSRYLISGLLAKKKYLITVAARNAVGYGKEQTITEETPTVQVPGVPTITSPKEGSEPNTYTLQWETPRSGGAPLSGFNIKYTEVEVAEKDGQKVERMIGDTETIRVSQGDATSYKLQRLNPSAYYELQLTAVNLKGESMAGTHIFKTAPGGMPVSNDPPAMATGAIIGIIIAVIIILFIVIDVTFYFTKQCGLLWTLKGKVAGGEGGGERTDAEAADHEKEAFIKEGKQDSEEQSAKENVDVVNETEKGDEDTKEKELEPEDKEEKVASEPAPEPAEEAQESAPPAGSPQTETAPAEASTDPAPETDTPEVPEREKDPKV